MILCWATFIDILSHTWPMGHRLDTPGGKKRKHAVCFLEGNERTPEICLSYGPKLKKTCTGTALNARGFSRSQRRLKGFKGLVHCALDYSLADKTDLKQLYSQIP